MQDHMRKLLLLIAAVFSPILNADLLNEVTHGYADNNGVKIHYVKTGQGPLVVMIHGFPDYWYTWRQQINALKENFTVVAMDQRGYNLSDQPKGVAEYAMPHLVSDVAAVIKHQGASSATVVGHDWGGAVAWQVAFNLPQMVDNLIILNLPHPSGMAREMATNVEQQKNSGYARKFIAGSSTDPDIMFGGPMTAETLSGWVHDKEEREHYTEAFKRSSFSGMLNFYKANYPSPDNNSPVALAGASPRLPMPVLIFHGLKDTALHSDGLNNTWDWVDNDVTIVTAPDAGHFVQQDAAKLVSQTMQWWLSNRQP
jgi:pimeloyl-ACP methyl ester carboxylesterase